MPAPILVMTAGALVAALMSSLPAAPAKAERQDAIKGSRLSTATAADKQSRPGAAAGPALRGSISGWQRNTDAPAKPDMAFGAYQKGHYLTALELALPRAQDGDPAAQTLLGEIFSRGLGVPRNPDDAAFWYAQAARGGDPTAQFEYALLLMEGRHVGKDEGRAAELMKKAADAGLPAAQFNHAQSVIAANPGEAGLRTALPYFEAAADAGIADAQYALSQIYLNAVGIPEHKRQKARAFLARAAEAGYDTAQLDLGIWLIDGIAGPKDYDAGFSWMKRAAEKGNVMAQNRLAHLYVNAIGTRPDPVEAAKWYVLSRRAGMEDHRLEDFYQGLTEDEQKQAIGRANAHHRS